MLSEKLRNRHILLASKSPRRQYLLKEAGIPFELINDIEVDESYPSGLNKFEIPLFLAGKKSDAYFPMLSNKTILITADTIVWFDGAVINKPVDRNDALDILGKLSGNMHEVITGVTLRSIDAKKSFYSHSEVYFDHLSQEEISYYIDEYKPYDKAGGYGIQEWIGYIGIERINGSFFNVMGLPIHKLYRELEGFI